MKKTSRGLQIGLGAVFVAFVVVFSMFGLPAVKARLTAAKPENQDQQHKPKLARAALVPGESNSLFVPTDVSARMGLKLQEVRIAPSPEPLKLDGSLFLDANSLAHVRARFTGEIMELGEMMDQEAPTESGKMRPIRFGDRVRQGQLMAVIWSKELGEKKSELVQAVAELRLDQEKLARLQQLATKGAVPEQSVRATEREVEKDHVAVIRAERTLRSWRLSQEEIEKVRNEANDLDKPNGQALNKDIDRTWARVEVRCPIDGTILEKNVAVGDFVSSDIDMFKVADLHRLDVLAHAYEDDLPELESLTPEQRRWTVFLKADSKARPMEGSFGQIGNIIDPSQHTALVMGWVDNSSGRLRIGQFVTAQIEIPAVPGEVAIPNAALIDQDGIDLVFVVQGDERNHFQCRRVHPTRRRDDLVYVESRPTDHERIKFEGLSVGDWVVTSGGVELAAELRMQQTEHADGVLPVAPPTSVPAVTDAAHPTATGANSGTP